MGKILQTVEYTIGSHFLPYIFNADSSGLNDEDITRFNEWWAREFDSWIPTIDVNDDDDGHDEFAQCDITGLMGDCHHIRAHRFEGELH